MYINPVLVGIIGTLFVEFAIFITFGVIHSMKNK